jgi:DNA polymerase-3 subunit beta
LFCFFLKNKDYTYYMQCALTKESIAEILVHADRLATKNASLPVLSCVKLKTEQNTLSLTATNLESGVLWRVAVQGVEDGEVAVPASLLLHVVHALPNGSTLSLKKKEQVLEVASAGSVSRIALHDVTEYPTLPTVEGGATITLPVKGLISALTSVGYCASASLVKPELASVFVHMVGGNLVSVATDSFRLAEKKVPLAKPVSFESFLVPAKSVSDVVRVLERVSGEEVSCTIGEHQCSIENNDFFATFRLIAGTFPDYTQIIPKEFATETRILRADFERVLRKHAPFSDSFNKTTLTIVAGQDHLTLHTENTAIGESTDDIPATKAEKDLVLRFNHRYLLDALHSISSDSISIACAGVARPAIIRPVGDESFMYLVMPMNR